MRAGSGWRLRVGAAVGAVVLLCAFAVVAGVATAGTQPISLTGVHPEDPAVSGTRVVWADKRYGYFDVFCYDSATGVTRRLTFGGGDHVSPAISGDTVVWADYRNGDADIWACDLATGVQRPLVVAVDDQIHPSISGKRLAWEDYRNGYNPAVRVLDVSTGVETVIASGYNQPAKRPRVSGDIVVWEDYAAQALGRTDPDVKACDLATGARIDVATTNRPEMLPSTDGRYVVWADSNGTDLDVRAYDTVTGRSMLIGGGAGEQTYPTVAGGVAYWLDNGAGKRLHVDTYDFASGRLARFNDYGTSDVAAVSASGGSVAWLARSGSAWKIRALIPGSTTAIAKLSRLLPAPAPSAVRLAQMGAPASEPPVVISTSVRRGALNVPRSSSFTVYFSKSLDPSSVTPAAVRVLDARGRPLRGRVRYASLAKAVTFTPAAPLGASTYTLAVAPTLADAAGSRLSEGQMVTFSTFGILADTIPPTAPASIVASVAGTTSVMLSWSAAWDNVGATGYDVYRSLTATAIANFPVDASLIVSVGATTTATFPVKADEAAKAYCYYYVAVARDAAGNTSPPSYNACPDPHGTYTPTLSTNLCMRCHSVHGAKPQLALGAKTAAACYVCHGATPGTGAYGAGSTFDTQGEFRDDAAIATAGPDLASGASIHRNDYMVSIQRECDACHTPHKRPFNYDPTVSYNRLLRTQLSTSTPATYRYNTDAAAVGNQFCADCHGPSLTNVGIVGGATAYSDTGGDHVVNYAASAHSPSSVPSNSGDTNPGIQCEACHNNHSSATNKLIDYRASGTTTTANNQSGLCFKCHSASGLEAGKPNTWNGRNVQTEFARTSHHPYAAGGGQWVQQTNQTVFSETLQADFGTDTLFQTQAISDGDGAAALATHITTINPPTQQFLFAHDGNNVAFDAYDAADDSWNTVDNAFNPTDYQNAVGTPGTGSSSYAANGKVYTTQGNSSATQWAYTPPAGAGTGTWSVTTTWPATIGAGGSSTIDSRAGENYVFASRGAGTNSIMWWQYTGATTGTINVQYPGGTNLNQNYGSSIAFAPGVNRLFLVNRNSGSGDGRLYYLAAPAGKTGVQTFTQGPAVVDGSSTTRYNKMCYFSVNGTEALAIIGRNSGGSTNDLVIVTNLGAASPTVTNVGQYPFTASAADGVDIEWDGGGYLYAIHGGATNEFERIAIPANPAVAGNWLGWTPMATSPFSTFDTGASLSFQNATPASYSGVGYWNAGTVQTGNITVPGTLTNWDQLSYDATVVAGTNLTVKVQGSTNGGGSWSDLMTATVSPTDLSGISPAYTTLRLVGQFTSVGGASTPLLGDWAVTADYGKFQESGALACVNCHNPHSIQKGAAGTAWQVARSSSPTNTMNTSANITDLCLGCHTASGSQPSPGISASSLVPYAIGFRTFDPATYPFFLGWDKSSGSIGFKSSGHFTTAGTKALCENCHDPHGSNNARLVAWTRPSGFTTGLAGTRDNTSTNAAESNLCFQCHGKNGVAVGGFTGRTATGSAGVFMDIATPMSLARAHPTTATGIHSDLEGPSNLGAGKRHAECVDCHDPHAARNLGGVQGTVHATGTAEAGPAVYGAIGVKPTYTASNWGPTTGYSTIRLDGSSGDYEAYLCFRCHSSYVAASVTASSLAGITSPSGNFTETNIAQEFNPANESGHNVLGIATWPKGSFVIAGTTYTWTAPSAAEMGLSAPWTATSKMTCSDCHGSNVSAARGPHGATTRYILKWGTAGTDWWSSTITGWSNTQNFCNNCHTTNSTGTAHQKSNHWGFACVSCHVKIPHGWKRPRLIGYRTDPPVYAGTDLTCIELMNYTSTGPDTSNCNDSAGCNHHGNPAITPWP